MQSIEIPATAIETALENTNPDGIYVSTEWLPDDWWNLFEDEQLSTFIQEAIEQNPTLETARVNVLLASSSAEYVKAALFPMMNWGGDVSREKFSETGIIPFALFQPKSNAPIAVTAGSNGIPVYFTQYESEFTLAYDFDLWGKNRKTWLAAIGTTQSKLADEAFMRIQLSIAVAKTYFQLQINYRRKKTAEQLIKNKEEYSILIQQRIAAALNNQFSFNQIQNNLAGAHLNLLQIQENITIEENALRAYLAGDFTEIIIDLSDGAEVLPRIPVPTCLPLHLLAHRPDILAQKWMIESAGKQIEVAEASFYPDFNLTALIGLQTIHLHELFLKKSSFFNVDPAVSLPIFDGGRLRANLRTSGFDFDLAILKYNDLVLNATREVLDALAVLQNTEQQLEQLKKQTDSELESLKLTEQRVANNIDSRLTFLNTQSNALIAQDQELQGIGNNIQAILSLIKALGGGF